MEEFLEGEQTGRCETVTDRRATRYIDRQNERSSQNEDTPYEQQIQSEKKNNRLYTHRINRQGETDKQDTTHRQIHKHETCIPHKNTKIHIDTQIYI